MLPVRLLLRKARKERDGHPLARRRRSVISFRRHFTLGRDRAAAPSEFQLVNFEERNATRAIPLMEFL